MPSPPPPGTVSSDPAEVADHGQLLELIPELFESSGDYRFQEAVEKIEALPLESPLGRTLKEDHVIAFQRAETFVGQFVEHLSGGNYEGTIKRKKGPVFQAKITSANRDRIEVDLGFGPNEVPLENLAADWMLEVAEEGWLGSASAPPQVGSAIWFSWCLGMRAEAEARAAEFQLPPFQERWKRMKEFTP